ncbi:MAG: hypothetical protein ABIP75_15470 [Pyrinomonadaceae bacterium]
MDIEDRLDKIRTREDLIEFIRALELDFNVDNSNWRNGSLPNYLERMAASIEDSTNCSRFVGEEVSPTPTWKYFADMLIAPKYYE